MSELTLILGGVRAGKSDFAEKVAQVGNRIVYIATAEVLDEEMRKRIENHKRRRSPDWETIESPDDLTESIRQIGSNVDVIIIDCLTVYISNLLAKFSEEEILKNVSEMLNVLNNFNGKTIFVSNEVGMGIVPDNKLARDYRDVLGRTNQMVAKAAKEVYLLVAGIPVKIKG
ncbi:MAG TPA: bifunctional adenosylcobinamide kinase/adenosylcobinamide-phosphate guanylyltransferase [Actinobacteria bacterium]|mgnify:CR=1 FL=1|nr:bifunctional adenosylcobinamide kinase/adenosylcobinamide-phosphate guanylyltransferase [Actinomycetota bacterium]